MNAKALCATALGTMLLAGALTGPAAAERNEKRASVATPATESRYGHPGPRLLFGQAPRHDGKHWESRHGRPPAPPYWYRHPGHRKVWVPGHWSWTGFYWSWVDGYWAWR
jgi:hypothetical protein